MVVRAARTNLQLLYLQTELGNRPHVIKKELIGQVIYGSVSIARSNVYRSGLTRRLWSCAQVLGNWDRTQALL
jgi:hypothetical protein